MTTCARLFVGYLQSDDAEHDQQCCQVNSLSSQHNERISATLQSRGGYLGHGPLTDDSHSGKRYHLRNPPIPAFPCA